MLPLVATHGGYQVGDQIRRVRCAETGDWVPPGRRWIAGNSRNGLVIAERDVEEIVRVAGGIRANLI